MTDLQIKLNDEIEAAHDVLNDAQVLTAETLAKRIQILADRAESYERENIELRKLTGVCAS